MFIFSSIFTGLDLWSINHTSIYENSESKVFLKVTFLGEISKNWLNYLLGINIYKAREMF